MTNNYINNSYSNNHKWYIIQCASRYENSVCSRLNDVLSSSSYRGLVSAVVVPQETVKSYKNGRVISRNKPLYPGYIYIKCKLNDKIISAVNTNSFIVNSKIIWVKFLGFKGSNINSIQPLSAKESVTAESFAKNSCANAYSASNFSTNDVVTVNNGDFNNVVGSILSVKNEEAVVAVHIFNRYTPINVNIKYLTKN